MGSISSLKLWMESFQLTSLSKQNNPKGAQRFDFIFLVTQRLGNKIYDVCWCSGTGNMDKVGAKHFVGGHVLDFFGFGYEIC